MILGFGAVNTEDLYRFCEILIIGDNHSSVTESAEIFAWEEGESSRMSYRSGLFSFVLLRSDRLRRIFDYMNTFALGDFHNRSHFGALTKQMDGHYRFCPRGDFLSG